MFVRMRTAGVLAALVILLAAGGLSAEPHTSPPVAGFWTLRTVTAGDADAVSASQAIKELAMTLADASAQLTIAPGRRHVIIVDGRGEERMFSTNGTPQPFTFDGHPAIVTTTWSRDVLVQRFQAQGEPGASVAVTYERAGAGTDLIAIVALEHRDGNHVMLQRRVYSSDAID